MSELKTKENDADVYAFIDAYANTEQKKSDSYELIKLMTLVTGEPPRMWGTSIIGFGKYHYKSERSSQEGDWPIIGFSPRKTALSLYVFTGLEEHESMLTDLGKFKKGKACIYVKKLSDIDVTVLEKLMRFTVDFMKRTYGVN
ncbi:DUF1801 domain-containing protein [Fusibacter tunisiensis]|uniref:YdhG-like domain-containing protein n=1 Tax=Fusibacter tunisiensis TaxID=1008308 RepID=A0ABS2MPY9_9FIRM|nr:DUF1801 domain-containing protein [Fusibacter tunisiensis]MBM7561447.1 hypothetical protein [Fusibacter tunisiensis]